MALTLRRGDFIPVQEISNKEHTYPVSEEVAEQMVRAMHYGKAADIGKVMRNLPQTGLVVGEGDSSGDILILWQNGNDRFRVTAGEQ